MKPIVPPDLALSLTPTLTALLPPRSALASGSATPGFAALLLARSGQAPGADPSRAPARRQDASSRGWAPEGKGPAGGALDATARRAALLGQPAVELAAPVTLPTWVPSLSPGASTATASLEELLPALVRRIGWSGHGRRTAIRLELGAGELAGATLVVQADGDRVRVTLGVTATGVADAWRERIAARLAARGVEVDAIEVA
jgi:hypothetical protein